MSERVITCIGCPMGCRLRVTLEGGRVEAVDGAECGRGAVYARQECVCPTRMVCSLARVRGRRAPLSVKTARPIPQEAIFEVMHKIHSVCVSPPVRLGDVIIRDVCGTGVDVVATMDVITGVD
jgi:CxxC motif-containing protein